MTAQHHPAPTADAAEPHGPGTPATLRPGERGSVLVLSPPGSAEEGMAHAVAWITAFEQDCDLVLDPDATSLYAVAEMSGLVLEEPDETDEGIAAHLDFVWADGVWHHRGTCPAAPEGSSANTWAWHVHRLQRAAAPGSLGTVWDVYPLPAAC